MIRTFHRLAIVLAVLAAAFTSAAPANADQNGGYSVPTPTASADYFDPHDQVHGDQPKLGGWGHEFGEFGHAPAPATTAGPPAGLTGTPCPGGKLCTYWDTFWWGSVYAYSVPFGPYPVCIQIGEPWDNDTSSVRNNTNRTVQFHTDHGCGNSGLNVRQYGPGVSDDWGGTIWNDRMSSIKWMP